MTAIPKSDAQLDAEAAANPDLAGRIALHRALAHAEVSIVRLHQRDGEDSGIGVPFAQPFIRFLDEQYGTAYPWSAGLQTIRHECRRSHSEHWQRPEWAGSLCYRLVSMICRFDWSYERACYDLIVTPERTERTLHRALRRIEERLAELQARASETVYADAGRHDFWSTPHRERHDQGGLHRVDCPACLRRAAA